MNMMISKTAYCAGLQCPKMLWLRTHRPELLPEDSKNSVFFNTGNAVGDLAAGLFGEFVKVPYGDPHNMVVDTAKLLSAGTGIVAEASFAHDDLFCAVDIVINLGNSNVELYEVKSSTSVYDVHRHDVAFQVYVLEKCGLTVNKAYVIHLDKSYVRKGELEVRRLFHIEDLTEEVRGMQDSVAEKTALLQKCTVQAEEPDKGIGPHCFAPYHCSFWPYCTVGLPEWNVFRLSGMQLRTKLNYYNQGIISYEELAARAKLSESQRMEIDHNLHMQADHIDKDKIREFLTSLTYPIYFLDFESFQPAIPQYDNTYPYKQIVFQYSLHYYEEENGPLLHNEFLAQPGEDPRRPLAELLCQDVPKGVCVVAYNMSFEKARIKEFAELYPDLTEHLMDIYRNIVDLMVPFFKRYYYTRAMEGSYSIKYVLPALFPDDPELDYHSLDNVHNGMEASAAFAMMDRLPPEEAQAVRANLLKYCGLDTYAMVKIFEKLRAL